MPANLTLIAHNPHVVRHPVVGWHTIIWPQHGCNMRKHRTWSVMILDGYRLLASFGTCSNVDTFSFLFQCIFLKSSNLQLCFIIFMPIGCSHVFHTFFVSVNTVGTLFPPCKVKTSLLSQSHLNPMQAKGKTRLETPCCRARAARGTKNNTSFPWNFEMKWKLRML